LLINVFNIYGSNSAVITIASRVATTRSNVSDIGFRSAENF